MLDWPAILADNDGFSSELLYVIAILILAGIGAIADKIKQKMAGQSKPPASQPGKREVPRSEIQIEEPPRRPAPARPAAPQRPPQQRQAPRPPVVWEAPQPRQPQRPQAPPRPRPIVQPAPPPPARLTPERPVLVEPTLATSGLAAVTTEAKPAADGGVGHPAGEPAREAAVKHPGIEWLALSRADLPRAVILSEILSPPIALREQERLF